MSANAPPTVLIVDDDATLRGMLAQFLGDHGLRVVEASDGARMFERLATTAVSVVLLDVMLPGDDGFALCRRLRAAGHPAASNIPIILLTSVNSDTDRVVGLELGADDYIAKPFNPRELLARIRALLRRSDSGRGEDARSGAEFRFMGWVLNPRHRSLRSPNGALTDLTSGEFDLLLAFLEHPQRILSRDQLIDLARGRALTPYDRSIDVQISRLRRKIEPDPQRPRLIKTVRNEGYFFAADVDAAGAGAAR
ncbi:response regulator [Lysobacter enzymogenes]|uniref:response regulator n=1 Tax=Lysobacter enzymogenes TaxID=69 RepID=UPI001A96883F|nr:response regulator [Lysobacter enzymogenes]QQP97987.1 response regulator [Lysobacter enzymogenes]